jgi:Xaa-Pro aminopeptidase
MLGMDVHDCGQASPEAYAKGTLAEGMVLTVEPGLYFQADDLLVPEEMRGIGIRIEDDILVTPTGVENLTIGTPKTIEEVERTCAEAPRLPR